MVIVFLAGMSIGTMFGVVLSGMMRSAKRDDEVRGEE
jgi:hypothetical protein